MQLVDDSGVFRRIARAVAEHNTVGVIGEHFFGGGGAGHTDDFTTAADQFAGNVFLGAEIPQHHGALPVFHGFVCIKIADGTNGAGDDIGAAQLCAGGDLAFIRGDKCIHHAALADDFCQAAGVDAPQAGNTLLLQEGIKIALAAEVGGGLAPLPYDVSLHPGARALIVGGDHAVIADQREGLHDDLTVITGIGQCFQIPGHGGGENDLTDYIRLGAERKALKYRAVFQYQICFFCHRKIPLSCFFDD